MLCINCIHPVKRALPTQPITASAAHHTQATTVTQQHPHPTHREPRSTRSFQVNLHLMEESRQRTTSEPPLLFNLLSSPTPSTPTLTTPANIPTAIHTSNTKLLHRDTAPRPILPQRQHIERKGRTKGTNFRREISRPCPPEPLNDRGELRCWV